MPVTIASPHRTDPTPGYGFAVQLGNDIAGWFTECSGLIIEREVKEHPEGGVNDFVHQLPGRIKRSSITLKHGLAGNELWEWFQQGLHDVKVERRNVSIVLYNPDLTEASRWELVDVYPSKWSGPAFKSDGNDVLVETLELAHVQSSNVSTGAVQRTPSGQDAVEETPTDQDIDIPALAKKVYDLLKQELRVERGRLG